MEENSTEQKAASSLVPIGLSLGCCSFSVIPLLLGIVLFIAILGFVVTGGRSSTPNSPSELAADCDRTTGKIDSSTMRLIRQNQSEYEKAAEKTNINWEMIAAVHFREGGNSRQHAGPSGEPPGAVNPDSHQVECQTFEECMVAMGKHLKSLADMAYGVKVTKSTSCEDLKKAFLAYNRGIMYKRCGYSPERSPYVMNNFNSQFFHMTFPPGTNNGQLCETVPGMLDTRNGALTVYVKLMGGGN